MEKRLTSLRPITEHRDKTKFCAHCGNVATQEAFFKVEGASRRNIVIAIKAKATMEPAETTKGPDRSYYYHPISHI